MSNIVKALKKGNQTLTEKVWRLEADKKRLIDENEKLKRENYELRNQVNNKKRDEDAIIHHFSGIYSKLLDVAISNIEDES